VVEGVEAVLHKVGVGYEGGTGGCVENLEGLRVVEHWRNDGRGGRRL